MRFPLRGQPCLLSFARHYEGKYYPMQKLGHHYLKSVKQLRTWPSASSSIPTGSGNNATHNNGKRRMSTTPRWSIIHSIARVGTTWNSRSQSVLWPHLWWLRWVVLLSCPQGSTSRGVHCNFTPLCWPLKWYNTPISFDYFYYPHNMRGIGILPIMAPTINNVKIWNILIDGGASLNVLSMYVFDEMKISHAWLIACAHLWGFLKVDPPYHL